MFDVVFGFQETPCAVGVTEVLEKSALNQIEWDILSSKRPWFPSPTAIRETLLKKPYHPLPCVLNCHSDGIQYGTTQKRNYVLPSSCFWVDCMVNPLTICQAIWAPYSCLIVAWRRRVARPLSPSPRAEIDNETIDTKPLSLSLWWWGLKHPSHSEIQYPANKWEETHASSMFPKRFLDVPGQTDLFEAVSPSLMTSKPCLAAFHPYRNFPAPPLPLQPETILLI